MKAWVVIAVLVAALYWEHRQRLNRSQQQRGPGRRGSNRYTSGVVRSTGSNVRQATQFATSGSSSPGSGVQSIQPAMASTWAIGGVFGPGNVGPTYLPEHYSKRLAS